MARRVVVLGGGVSVLALFEAMARADLGPLEVRLAARRPERAALLARHAASVCAELSPGLSIAAVDDLDRALEGADVVILLIRVGGAAARHRDEAVPASYGLVGDEGLGLGGAANAWRTAPMIEHLATIIGRRCPAALVLNLAAPLGLTTRWLLERNVPAVGICELPALTRERLEAAAPGPLRDVGYAGLNHAGWFVPNDAADGMAASALRERGLAAGVVDPFTWDRFGGVPLSYHYRVLDPERGATLGIRQPAGRAQQLQRGGEAIVEALRRGESPPASDRPTPWFDRALVPVLAAHFGGTPYRGAVNLTNGPRLPEVPPDVVIEVEATVERCSMRVEPSPPRPPAVAELLAALGNAEERLHHACVSRDVRELRDALGALPDELRPQTGDLDAAVTDVVAGEAIGS